MSTLKRYNGTDWVPIGPALVNADGNMFENIVASKYSPTANYNVGDYVLYNNKFYRCITKIAVAEPWTPSHWFETTVGYELGLDSETSGNKIFEITFGGIDIDDGTPRTKYSPDVWCSRTWQAIQEAYNDGYTLIAKILVSSQRWQGSHIPQEEEEYVYVPVEPTFWDGNIQGITVRTINYWGQPQQAQDPGYLGEFGYVFPANGNEFYGYYITLNESPNMSDVLRYSAQSLTTAQKTQARANIDAMSSDVNLSLEVKISYENSAYTMDQDMDDILYAIENGVPVVITCEEVSSWPGFSGYTNLRNVSITQLHVIRSGSSNDFDIVGDALLSFDETTRELQILHLSLSILSGITSIYPTVWGMLGAPLATAQDVGKWLKVDAYGYPVWANLPVYQGGVS